MVFGTYYFYLGYSHLERHTKIIRTSVYTFLKSIKEDRVIFIAFANAVDPQIEWVQSALKKRGRDLILLDTSNYPDHIGIHFEYPENTPPTTLIHTNGQRFSAEDVQAVWVRRYNTASSRSPHYNTTARQFTNGEAQMMVDGLALIWPESSPWVSKPDLIRKACNKPYNLMMAQKLGFQIPKTAFTNDLPGATDFLKTHNPVAMKTLSALWIRPEEEPNDETNTESLQAETDEDHVNLTVFYVRKYESQELLSGLDGLPDCPVIFQSYIPKQLELRVTVIGQQVFTCAIYSQESLDNTEDYRVHWTNNLRLETFQLPSEVEKRCIQLVQTLGLEIGCIDLILTPDEEYVYLEINPVGQWAWVEERTGLPIANAIADLLIATSGR